VPVSFKVHEKEMEMHKQRHRVTVLLVVALSVIGLAAATPAQAKVSGKPLKFGVAITLTGPNAQPQALKAIQAYFADWNKRGGYKGRPVQLISEDAGGDATTGAAAAQKLVNADNVLALVGNFSPLDCGVNGNLYESAGIASVANPVGNDCYSLPHVFPVEPNPLGKLTPSITWAVQQGARKIAAVYPDIATAPGTKTALTTLLAKTNSGAELVLFKQFPLSPTAADADGFVADLKSAGADTVYVFLTVQQTAQVMDAAARANYGPKQSIRWIGGPTTYSSIFPSQVGASGEGIYGTSLALAYEGVGKYPKAKRAVSVMKKTGVSPLDSFVQFSWETGNVLEQALGRVKGAVTRESVYNALRGMQAVKFVFSPGITYDYTPIPSATTPRSFPPAGQVVQMKNGKWSVVSKFFKA
jgi:branched-chain amino acid transport system substrate-binding protein